MFSILSHFLLMTARAQAEHKPSDSFPSWFNGLAIQKLAENRRYSAGAASLAWRSDGQALALRYGSGEGLVVQVDGGSLVARLPAAGNLGSADSVVYLPHSNLIALGGAIKGQLEPPVIALTIVDGGDGHVEKVLVGENPAPLPLAWQGKGPNFKNPVSHIQYIAPISRIIVRQSGSMPRLLAYNITDWTHEIWDIGITGGFHYFDFHPNGKEVCLERGDIGPVVVEVPSGRVIHRLPSVYFQSHPTAADKVAYSSNGDLLATWTTQYSHQLDPSLSRLKIYETRQDYRLVAEMGSEVRAIHELAFHNSGNFLALAGDGQISLIGLSDFKVRYQGTLPSGVVTGMRFSPNGRRLACGIAGDEAALIVVDPQEAR